MIGNRRLALATLLVLACESAVTGTGESRLFLQVDVAADAATSTIDQAVIHIEGPTSLTRSAAPGSTETIEGLLPGSYTVALEGFNEGGLELFGERSGVTVVAGENRTVTITLQSFIAGINSVNNGAPITAGQPFVVDIAPVAGAAVYEVIWLGPSNGSTVTSTTSVTITIEVAGDYQIAAVATNRFGSSANLAEGLTATVDPAIQPLTNHIAFSAGLSGTQGSFVHVVPAEGGQPVPLAAFGEGLAPDISPDGLYVAYHFPTGQILVVDAQGSQVVYSTADGCYPAWSPDGSQLAFATSCAGGDIALMNADGSNVRVLTTGGGNNVTPRWSPDGQRITYSTDRDGSSEIYVIDADGSNDTRLTNSSDDDRYPDFSPDGTKITWERLQNGVHDVWSMDTGGARQVQVTNSGQSYGRPSWSPGRDRMVMTRGNEIYTFKPDGSDVVRVTDTGGTATDAVPRWGPCLESSCTPTTGQIEIATVTTGAGLDPDGYTVSVQGATGTNVGIGVNDYVTVIERAPGDYTLTLSGLDTGCTLLSANPITVNVAAGQLSQPPQFDVNCIQNAANRIVVTPSTLLLPWVGSSMVIYGTPFDAAGDPIPGFIQIFFATSNPSVATVDANGRLTAQGVGTATITVTDGMGRSGTMEVTVASAFQLVQNFGGHMYAATVDPLSWVQSALLVRQHGGHLVAVTDANENGFLTSLFASPLDQDLWIGLNDRLTEDVWQWTDDSPPVSGATTTGPGFSAWRAGEPNEAGSEDCAHFGAGPVGDWNDLFCGTPLRAIAEWDFVGPDIIDNVSYFNGHRYAITHHTMSWVQARNLAVSLGGRLVTLEDAAENEFLTSTYPVVNEQFWFGLSDRFTEGMFQWVGSSLLGYTNWFTGEPNDDATFGEDCGLSWTVVGAAFTWNDAPCSEQRRAFIEWPELY